MYPPLQLVQTKVLLTRFFKDENFVDYQFTVKTTKLHSLKFVCTQYLATYVCTDTYMYVCTYAPLLPDQNLLA